MRLRIWLAIGLMLFAVALAGCSAGRAARETANTPVPTKTLRPTFTHTPVEPTRVPTDTPAPPSATPAEAPTQPAPTETPAPVPTASPTPSSASLTADATVNVRSGPGTNYNQIGQLRQGQSFVITGKNPAGDWLQFDFNGRSGWVLGRLVRVSGADLVQVAANIPPAPTARPVPTAAPRRPAPTQPPAPSPAPATRFAVTKSTILPDTNDWITIYCAVFRRDYSAPLPGTIRVLRDGAVIEQGKAFSGFLTAYLHMPYNDGCKVEMRPANNGTYTAMLVENGQPISDVFTLNVTGTGNRVAIIEFKEK